MVLKSLRGRMILCYCVALALCLFLSHTGSNAVTVLVERSASDHRTCIALDAGHGGIDGGAVSISGIPESQINLEITTRLNDLLHLFGYKTFMLRNTDSSLHTEGATIGAQKISDLKNRVQMIENNKTSLLISIHQNTFSDKRYSGAQVFHRSDPESAALAEHLQCNFIKTLNPGSKRKPKQAKGIYLMEHLSCPAILIECGFLTNAQEEALLRTETYQKQLCCAIAATISSDWNK